MKYRSLKGWKYELLEDMECSLNFYYDTVETDYVKLFSRSSIGTADTIVVKTHYHWDGPSGPTFDTPTNMRASLFHDALCQLIGDDLLDKKYRKYADELLRVHMLEDQALYADGILWTYILGDGVEEVKEVKKMKGWKRAIYLRWGKFRANGYYMAVRANSKLKGM